MNKDLGLALLAALAAILFFIAISTGASAQAPVVPDPLEGTNGDIICVFGECAPIPQLPTIEVPVFGDGMSIACAVDPNAPHCKH